MKTGGCKQYLVTAVAPFFLWRRGMTPHTLCRRGEVKVLFSSTSEADGRRSRLEGLINDQMSGHQSARLKGTALFCELQILFFCFYQQTRSHPLSTELCQQSCWSGESNHLPLGDCVCVAQDPAWLGACDWSNTFWCMVFLTVWVVFCLSPDSFFSFSI